MMKEQIRITARDQFGRVKSIRSLDAQEVFQEFRADSSMKVELSKAFHHLLATVQNHGTVFIEHRWDIGTGENPK